MGEVVVETPPKDEDGAIPLKGFNRVRVVGLKTDGVRLDISTTFDDCGGGSNGLAEGIWATEVFGTGNLFSVCESSMEG